MLDSTHRAKGYKLVYQIAAEEVRRIQSGSHSIQVVHDPVGDRPIDCAHSTFLMPAGMPKKDVKYALARAMQLVYGRVTLEPPEGA